MKLLRSIGGALSVALILGLLVVAAPAGAQTLNSLTMEIRICRTRRIPVYHQVTCGRR